MSAVGDPDRLPVACTLGPDDGRLRMSRWQRLHEIAAPAARLDTGLLDVTYRAGPGVLEELTELAAAESQCCGFVTWSVSIRSGQPVLRVTGTPDEVAAIAGLFAGGTGG